MLGPFGSELQRENRRDRLSPPFFRLAYVREGVDPASPRKLLLGALHYLTVALIAVAIGTFVASAGFRSTFAAVFLGGLLGSDFITIGEPVWFHLPWDYTRGVIVFEVISWLLLAVLVARLVRPLGRI